MVKTNNQKKVWESLFHPLKNKPKHNHTKNLSEITIFFPRLLHKTKSWYDNEISNQDTQILMSS